MSGEAFLVTGGSGGIGSALCAHLAEAGYVPLVGYGAGRARAEATAARLGGEAVALDLTQPQLIDAAVLHIAARAEPLAGVVLGASPPPELAPLGKVSDADMTLQWEVNVAGPRRLLAALTRRCFRKRRRGLVIGVLSAAMGRQGAAKMSSMGAYLIAKHGLDGLLSVAAADYTWLQVGRVYPGFTDTPMLKAFDRRFIEGLEVRSADAVAADVMEVISRLAQELAP
ncbi:MAG: SDR family oxidoreductase [Myxococcales bacterium]|nr:SDR family oxidoreductase [Myxococcales bacterium]